MCTVHTLAHICQKQQSTKQSAHAPGRHFANSVYEISTTRSFHSRNVAVMHKLHEFGCQCVFPRITVPHVWPWRQLKTIATRYHL